MKKKKEKGSIRVAISLGMTWSENLGKKGNPNFFDHEWVEI